jgi:A/G-specific adenine glycosylase
LQKNCIAYHQGLTQLLPVRSKKIQVATRDFNYLLLEYNGALWVNKRTGQDIWASLHEPYLIETEAPITLEVLKANASFLALGLGYANINFSGAGTQKLTHRIIKSSFFTISLNTMPSGLPEAGIWAGPDGLAKIAFPKTVLSFLKNNLYF